MPIITRDEYLTINAIVLATPAWEALDLSGLRDAASLRGGDRTIPFKEFQQPRPRKRDVFRTQIPVDVYGDFDQDGNAYTDPIMGVDLNMDVLRDGWIPSTIGDGTFPIVWHLRDGSERIADGFVITPLQPQSLDPYSMTIVVDLLIPGGGFTIASSS